jgi:hypothetical protein
MANVAPQPLSQEEGPPSPSAVAPPPPQPATPEEEMPATDRRQTAAADDAVMGAAGDMGGFEVYDESGELVKGLFFKFLLEL